MKKIVSILLVLALMLSVSTVLAEGTFRVGMECGYAPYNWTQPTDANGAVPIKDSNEFATGYDVMMAKKLCGWPHTGHSSGASTDSTV